MLSRDQIGEMALFVAKAIHKEAAGDEEWGELTADEQEQFTQIAYAAIGTHDAWLNMHGFAIVAVKAMAGSAKKLITPAKPKLIGLN